MLVALTHYAMYTGHLAQGHLAELIRNRYASLLDRHMDPDGDGANLSAERARLQARFRDVCKDGLNLALMMYGDYDNKLRQRDLLVCTRPVRHWHGTCSHICRSVEHNFQFALQEVQGRYFGHLFDLLRTWSDQADL